MEKRHFLRAVVYVTALAALGAGCAKEEPESDGFIALVNGQVVKVDETEQTSLCANQRCEPNYIYTASFGRRRKDPQPAPPPFFPPGPGPTPGPPSQPAERLDYSRTIMNVPRAWAVNEGSRDVIVAVVDSGVDATHPDLAGNIFVNEAEKNGRPGVDDDGNGYVDDVNGWDFVSNRPGGLDDNKHGTHCAGIIGAESNSIGSVGVTKHVRILPLKFLAANGSGDSLAAIRAIYYAADNGARVISNSWGGGPYSQFLDQAIQYARSKGAIVVAAAGNSAQNTDITHNYPSDYMGVISVASTDESDALSSFSNYGAQTVTLAAPGSRIYSTTPGGNYEVLSGTSMATPQVAGALALGLSVRPDADEATIVGKLCDTSKKILLDRMNCGRMDVGAFIESL